MRPPRFRLRTLMVAVAMSAALLGVPCGFGKLSPSDRNGIRGMVESGATWLAIVLVMTGCFDRRGR